jgi:ribonuclease HI
MQRLSTTIKNFCDTVRRKFVPAGQCIYLINRVLIPRLIYTAQIMTLTEHDWNHVFAPVMKLAKNWMKLPKNTPSSLLFHEGCLGMDHPWKIHCINIITDLTIRLNSDSHAAISTHIRLRDAQLKSLITDPIFDCDLHVMPWIKLQTRKNVSFNALVIGKALDISMAMDPIDRSTWSVSGGKEPLLKFFKQYQLTKYIYRINQSSHYPIFYIDQLFIRGTYLMTWKQYRRLALLPVRGRVARWYRDVAHLCTSRIDNLTVMGDLELAEVNHWAFLLDITPDARRKQVIFVREPLADSDAWSIGKVNKIRHHGQGILVNYRPGYNDNGIIGWQDMGRSIPAHCCKVAILDKESNMRSWSFPSEWLSSTHQPNISIPDDRLPTPAPNPIISLPLVQDIWIHRWIDDDNLKAQLMDIRNILAERKVVEYYTDGSLKPSTPTSMGKQDPNLVYTDMGAAFCVNNEPALSAQANVSLWPSSTRSELVAIFLALLTGPMNAKIKIYTDSQSAIYMINNQHNKSGRKLLKQSNSLILLKIDILLQEKKMDLVLVKVKGHSGDVMNEMVDELAKNTSNSSCYFNNRFNYSNRTVRFFPIFKQIPIEYNLRKFIKTIMNTRVAAEWSMLKTNGHEIPIAWNITWNLIHRYKGFNCISVKKHWHLIFIIKLFAKLLPVGTILIQRKPNIYKDFVCPRCNANKEEDIYHFIECDANKDLWPIIKSRMQDDVIHIVQKWSNMSKNTPKAIREKLDQILGSQCDNNKFIDFCLLALEAKVNTNLSKVSKQLFGFSESKNILFLASLLDSFIIHFKELIWLPRCNATIAWEKARNIGRKDKLNESEYMDRYLKSSHQQSKHSRQDKHLSKKNDLPISQEDQTVVLDDILFELDPVQSENSLNENFILSKYYRMEKKVCDQMCLLINNNCWYNWAYKKTKNIIDNVLADLITT